MGNINNYIKNFRKTGDKKSFEKIYYNVMPKIYRFYYLKTLNRELSEDLTSEVFIRVFRNLKKTNLNERSFMVWIYRIANNLFIDHYRKSKNISDTVDVDEDPIIVTDEENLIRSSSFLRKEFGFENTEVIESLNRLTKLQQDIITLKFVEDLDYNTVAQIFNKKESTIRGIVFRALANLKKDIKNSNE